MGLNINVNGMTSKIKGKGDEHKCKRNNKYNNVNK